MDCDAYCTALSYDTRSIFNLFHGEYETQFIDKVVHVIYQCNGHFSDLFFFPYGTFVAWDLAEEGVRQVVAAVKASETSPLDIVEHDNYRYQYTNRLIFSDELIELPSGDVKAKLAFSHGFAQSAKLEAFEKIIQTIYEENKYLPESLAQHGKIPLSRYQIRKKLGQLFLDRTSINLHLGLLDTPEFFWDHPEFEPLYAKMTLELELRSRTGTLNQQLGVLQALFEMLSQELSDQHSSRLEWAIIWLIVLEVLLVFFHDVAKVI